MATCPSRKNQMPNRPSREPTRFNNLHGRHHAARTSCPSGRITSRWTGNTTWPMDLTPQTDGARLCVRDSTLAPIRPRENQTAAPKDSSLVHQGSRCLSSDHDATQRSKNAARLLAHPQHPHTDHRVGSYPAKEEARARRAAEAVTTDEIISLT